MTCDLFRLRVSDDSLTRVTGLNPGRSRDSQLYLMDFETATPSQTHTYTHLRGGRQSHTAALEEQLMSYSENAENEEEEEAYMEDEVLQVPAGSALAPPLLRC